LPKCFFYFVVSFHFNVVAAVAVVVLVALVDFKYFDAYFKRLHKLIYLE